jgi:omega-6 fatty acid desaturase (delta-12 desaturase)
MSNDACSGRERPYWKEPLAPYAQADLRRSLTDLATSVLPYCALFVAMYLLLDVSVLLTLALAPLAGGFLLRTYIVFHDCAHGSFLPSKRANNALGVFTGLLVYSEFASWRHSHAMHHASAGDLDRRGDGDVPTFTVSEYRAMAWYKRLGYRLFRNPVVMFGLGPIWALVIQPRVITPGMRPRLRRSIMWTNLAVAAMVAAMVWVMGWQAYLLVQWPAALLAGMAGVWLFYVQHQFEDVYWENSDSWSYADAALQGSSYLKLPKLLQFFTGNIGLHHVHHLSARIPNYNLQRAHDENEIFHSVPQISFLDGVRAVRLKLYDEDRGRLVTWAEARTRPSESTASSSEPMASLSGVSAALTSD